MRVMALRDQVHMDKSLSKCAGESLSECTILRDSIVFRHDSRDWQSAIHNRQQSGAGKV